MRPLIVVDNPQTWPLDIPETEVASAKQYLTDPHFAQRRGLQVFNLCRSYRYQATGYYVSLLALARGHKPLPALATIQDMKSLTMRRLASEELDPLMQRSLRFVQSNTFVLSIYFGRNLAKRYDTLTTQLFRCFRAPLLRAEFARDAGSWRLRTVRAIAAKEIPGSHLPFVTAAARRFFEQKYAPSARRSRTIYSLAILHDPDERTAPSNPRALTHFAAAARRLGIGVELIQKDDYARLAEFDALFIRETTAVNHHTYRFARRAAAEGLVVIDDPESILKCTNKVFLSELLARHQIPQPRTLIVHAENRDRIAAAVGFPCVLKQPDSSFSQGVEKVEDPAALQAALDPLLAESALVIAQAFTPTAFDWRIGIVANAPLYACRYHMVPAHWQIIRTEPDGQLQDGLVDAVDLNDVPRPVLRSALRAARLIGDGLYGVDVKQVRQRALVIEVNDNPSIDSGFEDRHLKRALYDRIMSVFLERITATKHINGKPPR